MLELERSNQNVHDRRAPQTGARQDVLPIDNRNALLVQGLGYRITAISNIQALCECNEKTAPEWGGDPRGGFGMRAGGHPAEISSVGG